MASRKKSRGRSGTPAQKKKATAAAAPTPSPATPASPQFSYAQAALGLVAPPPNTTGEPEMATSDGDDLPFEEIAEQSASLIAYEEALDDVHTRFILNLPPEELATPDRIFFQLEQAFWFYDDFLCDEGDDPDKVDMPKLPRFKSLHPFAKKMFAFSPLLQPMRPQFGEMWEAFRNYKHKISTYGTILMNYDCTRIALCQSYYGGAWTFPAGKVNQNESGVEAGARETYEETGFDPNCLLGDTKRLKAEAAASVEVGGENLPWSELRKEDALTYVEEGTKKRRTCYVCRGVPEDFPFAPVARKEVSEIAWYGIDDIPKKSFAVTPFLKQLRRWTKKNARDSAGARHKSRKKGQQQQRDASTKKGGRSGSRPNSRPGSRGKDRSGSRGKVRENDPLAASGLASPGDDKGWTAEQMFEANEKLTGHHVAYDGNPHVFADRGFDGNDPHAFRVVGGEFMNSGGVRSLAPAPEKSRLQPLFRPDAGGGGDGGGDPASAAAADGGADGGGDGGGDLKPFFSDGGETPWGEVVQEALEEEAVSGTIVAAAAVAGKKTKKNKKSAKGGGGESTTISRQQQSGTGLPPSAEPVVPDGSNATGMALLSMLQGGGDDSGGGGEGGGASVFMTDRDITAKSQQEKLGKTVDKKKGGRETKRSGGGAKVAPQDEDEHMRYLREWVRSLPQSPSTDIFGDFRLDVDAVMHAAA